MSGRKEARKARPTGQRTGPDRDGLAPAQRGSVCPSRARAFSRGGRWLEKEQCLLIILVNLSESES